MWLQLKSCFENYISIAYDIFKLQKLIVNDNFSSNE